MLAAALALGLGWPWWGCAASLAVLAQCWWSGRRWLVGPGPGLRRLAEDGEGGWLLQDPGRGLRQIRLQGRPRQLGPCLWMPFRDNTGSLLLLIDASSAEPAAFCRLKAVLKRDFRRLESEVGNA